PIAHTLRSLPRLQSPAWWLNRLRRLKERLRVSFIVSMVPGFRDVAGPFVGAPGGRALPVSSTVVAASAFIRILGTNGECDSAARGELRSHDHLPRRARFHEVVQDAVGDRLVEGTLIPRRGKIKFERFAFDAEPIRHVIDIDPGKIRLTRNRTNGRAIIRFKMKPVVSAR